MPKFEIPFLQQRRLNKQLDQSGITPDQFAAMRANEFHVQENEVPALQQKVFEAMKQVGIEELATIFDRIFTALTRGERVSSAEKRIFSTVINSGHFVRGLDNTIDNLVEARTNPVALQLAEKYQGRVSPKVQAEIAKIMSWNLHHALMDVDLLELDLSQVEADTLKYFHHELSQPR